MKLKKLSKPPSIAKQRVAYRSALHHMDSVIDRLRSINAIEESEALRIYSKLNAKFHMANMGLI